MGKDYLLIVFFFYWFTHSIDNKAKHDDEDNGNREI
jgi:hypothetical protein